MIFAFDVVVWFLYYDLLTLSFFLGLGEDNDDEDDDIFLVDDDMDCLRLALGRDSDDMDCRRLVLGRDSDDMDCLRLLFCFEDTDRLDPSLCKDFRRDTDREDSSLCKDLCRDTDREDSSLRNDFRRDTDRLDSSLAKDLRRDDDVTTVDRDDSCSAAAAAAWCLICAPSLARCVFSSSARSARFESRSTAC